MKIVPIAKPCVIDTKAPYSVAKLFLDKFVTRMDARTLHHHRGAFYKWNGRAYLEKADGELRSEIYPFLDQSFVQDQKGNLQPVKPNASMVTNVLDGLRAASHLDGAIAAPCWLHPVSNYPAEEIVACENGLLHLPTGKVIVNTPEFFTYNVTRSILPLTQKRQNKNNGSISSYSCGQTPLNQSVPCKRFSVIA